MIVTHDHADHCHGIDDLRAVAQNLGCRVPLHARAETLARLGRRFAYAFEGTPHYPAVLEPVAIEGAMTLGGATLTFVDQPHGGITSLGIRADDGEASLGYAIDFHEMTDDMAALYQGAQLWVCLPAPHPASDPCASGRGARVGARAQCRAIAADPSRQKHGLCDACRRIARLGGAGI